MTDKQQQQHPRYRPLDPGRVDMLDHHERRYWCAELGCTEEELARAVDSVGEHVAALRDYLESTGPRGR